MTNVARFFPVSLLAVALVAACTGSPDRRSPDDAAPRSGDPLIDSCGPVTAGGFCGVAVGMTADEAARAFPGPLRTFDGVATAREPLSCFMLFPEGRANDLSFMVADGRVARVDVRMPGIRTEAGVGVGTREADVLSRFQAQAESFPNKYDPTMRDIVVAASPNGRYVFQTDGQRVVRYRAGVLPAVGFVEGCG